eukprot:1358289-Amorphochlora_amoeboformis.AAC.1
MLNEPTGGRAPSHELLPFQFRLQKASDNCPFWVWVRLAPFFVDPERRVGMRFDIYRYHRFFSFSPELRLSETLVTGEVFFLFSVLRRISDEIVNSFWRFRNNIIVQVTLTKPVGKVFEH